MDRGARSRRAEHGSYSRLPRRRCRLPAGRTRYRGDSLPPTPIWLYLRFTQSHRDVEDLLAERGLDISYETVRRWVLKFERQQAEVRFARDSPLEGGGFELPVPLMSAGIFAGVIATQEFALGLSQLGTDGSNPSPSSGESANLCSARSVC